MHLEGLEIRLETQIMVLEQHYTRDALWEEWNTRCNTLFEGKSFRNVQKWESMIGLYRPNIKCDTTDSNAPSLFARRWTVGCCVIVIPVLQTKSPSISSIYLQFQAPFCDTMQPERGWYLDSEWKILLQLLKATGFSVSERVRALQKHKSEVQTLSELGGDSITNDYNAESFEKHYWHIFDYNFFLK